MMAHSGRDPLFWAALDVANNDIPGSGEFCLRCHVPSAWLAGRASAGPPGQVGDADGCALTGEIDTAAGFADPASDFSGVACQFCHRLEENDSPPMGQQSLYLENAQFWLADVACAGSGEPCRFGPYEYPQDGVAPPHAAAQSDYHLSSDLCALCHDVTNPLQTLKNASGDTGILFPAERTFTEWSLSDYAAEGNETTCQDCHMPISSENPAFACLQAQNDRTGVLSQHEFVGANAFIPEVLAGEYPNLQLGTELQATADSARDMLANRTATLEVEVSPFLLPGRDHEVSVRVTNLAGHKLPTGYAEGRRMWLSLELVNSSGQTVWQSGAYNAQTGTLASDPQLQVYERISGTWNAGTQTCETTDGMGRAKFHFVLEDCIAKDNRIPPLGFTGGSNIETQPIGAVYPETAPGSGVLVNYDDVTYTVPVPETGLEGSVTLRATLRHQIARREYVEFLRNQATEQGFADDCTPRSFGSPSQSRGEYMFDLWEQYGRSAPVTIDQVVMPAEVLTHLFSDGFESGNTAAW